MDVVGSCNTDKEFMHIVGLLATQFMMMGGGRFREDERWLSWSAEF